MSDQYSMVMTTTDSEDKAATLARKIVEARLAACVQIMPIRSMFMWEGKLDDAAEYLLLIKTQAAAYPKLQDFINDNHDYDVPEILNVPVSDGNPPYLSWVVDNTSAV